MKFNVEVECTPEEARAFLGLPDVRPLHANMMGEIENRMRQALAATDPSAFVEGWMPLNRNLQEFWTRMMQTAAAGMTTGRGTETGKGSGKTRTTDKP